MVRIGVMNLNLSLAIVGLFIAITVFSRIECRKTSSAEVKDTTLDRKITIIVADEETTTEAKRAQERKEDSEKVTSNCKKKPKSVSRFNIDETTKLIYIDKDNESGFLSGEIVSADSRAVTANQLAQAAGDGQPGERNVGHESSNVKHLPAASGTGRDSSGATNFSVFLVSRHREHIAIVLDIEEIDFEPTVNCDNQEIRFSIIGEISKQLLEQKESGEAGANSSDVTDGDASTTASDSSTGQEEQATAEQQETGSVPPLPMSEAITLLLNSPLNKTILDDSDDSNDFKLIESTIDYLHKKTCNDLIKSQQEQNKVNKARGLPNDRSALEMKAHRQMSRRTRGRKSTRAKKKHNQPEEDCQQDSEKFKSLMSERLRDHFKWDEFKIICGKTKELVIPMRSMKLSIYSDEFSPNSSFRLRYKFISDPSLLPAFDNGKYYCRNRNIIDLSLKCNGIDDCGDASDESIKTCGYPTARNGQLTSTLVPSARAAASNGSTNYISSRSTNRKRLTYVNGDVLHCCQTNEWLSLIPNAPNNELNLQSLIGDSMNLFSGPIYAPARDENKDKNKSKARHRVKRIVGGGVAQKGMWPGQVSLQYELLEPLCHFCAGTLIHPQYVLTAGHCISKEGLARGIKVVLGAHDLRQLNGSQVQVRYVDDAHIYPGVDVKQLNFDWENDMNNDIALLRLNAPVLVTQHVAPACLPPFNRPLTENATCRSIGWGQTHGSGNSSMLKHLTLKVVNSSNCSKELDLDREIGERKNLTTTRYQYLRNRRHMMGSGKTVSDFESTVLDQFSDGTMVCVKNNLGHGICQGDSGGPLYCDRINSNGDTCTEIYGVASFIIQHSTVGAMCAVENLPEIFGEVSSKTEWISATMKMFEQTYKLKYS